MAKPIQPAAKAATKRPSHDALRERAAYQRRNQNLLLIGGAALFVLLIGFVVYLNIQGEQPVAGEQTLTSQGNSHIEFGATSPLAYNSIPPTSGPHYGNLVAWNVYGPDQPQRYENLVHNLEDAGVVIYYQCPDNCPDIVKQLTDIADPYLKAGKHVAVVPNNPKWTVGNSQPLHQDMGAKIALTAWTKILKMDQVDATKIRKFIDRYEGIDHHVGAQG
ncbi:MAG: DUF3105 domain-containing protein [Caldilineaceae bacterium]